MRLRVMELPRAKHGDDAKFALIVDRLDLTSIEPGTFLQSMATFRDNCGAVAVLVSENDIELDGDPALIEDTAPDVAPVLARMRELRTRLNGHPPA
jgi:hypothetical protein